MTHAHTWRLRQDIVLTLPEASGYRDKLLTWVCACGEFTVITGSFHITTHGLTLAAVEAMAAQERRAGTPLARVARQSTHGRSYP